MAEFSWSQSSFLFAGLGNPGREYEQTRHNLGFLVVAAFSKRVEWTWKEDKRFNAYAAKGTLDGITGHLILPQTYMNLSGTAIRSYMDYYKLPIDSLVVVADDVALPFGQMRLKAFGSAGGHNGLKSIETYLGTSHYKRLRMGIGHPGERVMADYVLEPFNQEETKDLAGFVDRGAEVLLKLLKAPLAHVMNAVNVSCKPKDLTKPLLEGEEKTDESKQTKPL